MNELKIFTNSEFGDIRTTVINNEPYLMLNDVCRVLDINNPSKAKTRLKEDGLTTSEVIDSMGRTQQATFINESNLYKLIFQSRKPEAEKFSDWITGEVIPSIRKHGAYMTPQTLEEMLLNPDAMIKTLQALKEEQIKRQQLEIRNSTLTVENQVMKPKAEYFDDLVDRNLLTNFRDTAKMLKIGERKFIQFLLDKKYLYRNTKGTLLPFAGKNNSLFEIKECKNDKTEWAGPQTLITPKGRETFRLLCMN